MPFELRHVLASKPLQPVKRTSGSDTFFEVSDEDQFAVLYPGRLVKDVNATFSHRMPVPRPEGIRVPHVPGSFGMTTITIPLTLKILTPDGVEFTGAEVTLADLRKFRDRRGVPFGLWSYKLSGRSQGFQLDDVENITNAKGSLELALNESVRSASAPPLVSNARLDSSRQEFRFDLLRVGTLVAEITSSAAWNGSMRLVDPDGTAVARSTGKKLTFEVELAALGKSRDKAGRPRPWVLEVAPHGGVVVGDPHLSVTVIASGRISTAVLRERIARMIGRRGDFLKVYGENKDGKALGRLVITDVVAAETLDMYHVLDKALKADKQDLGVDPRNVDANTVYTLGRRDEVIKWEMRLDVSSLKLDTLDITIGPGVKLGGTVAAVRLSLAVSGEANIKLGPATIASGKLHGGKFEMEVGVTVDPDGTPRVVAWFPDRPFDISLDWGLVLTLGVIAGPLIAQGSLGVTEILEEVLNGRIASAAREILDFPFLAPTIMMTIFGAHLTFLPVRFEGEDIVFHHIAPLEPDPQPREDYAPIIGREFTETDRGIQVTPPTLGDTWAHANLTQKIKHIVVVMMENRSYDHVLGYRARGSSGDGADGLTPEIVAAIEAADGGQHKVRMLKEAGFADNQLGLKTRLPRGVGHAFADVREQLKLRAAGPDGREINHPKGFVDNFAPRVGTPSDGVEPDDVLGYYDATDLPFFKYLADNYAYCDRFYSSHPGPTLPNRMYSLTGDVQYDRLGVPILDNNHGDNFLLSRALTIYDLLTKRGLKWRVYESDPSITMLRMFARYATNRTEIVSYTRLAADVANGDLPPFVAIEPAMHHHPENDDHPDADMYRGQIFLKWVYDTLRSNRELWKETLLIITYDEHGGLYDHVVPPVADMLSVVRGREVHEPLIEGPRGRHVPIEEILRAAERPPLPIPYGVRVPTFVVSPWTTPGKGDSVTLDHCSILKTVLATFAGDDKPFLNDRVHASYSFDAFLKAEQPRMDVPASPTLGELPLNVRRLAPGASAIETAPLSRKQMRQESVDYHLLTGRLARMLGR